MLPATSCVPCYALHAARNFLRRRTLLLHRARKTAAGFDGGVQRRQIGLFGNRVNIRETAPQLSLRGALATKQSSLCLAALDCFAKPVIGRALARPVGSQ